MQIRIIFAISAFHVLCLWNKYHDFFLIQVHFLLHRYLFEAKKGEGSWGREFWYTLIDWLTYYGNKLNQKYASYSKLCNKPFVYKILSWLLLMKAKDIKKSQIPKSKVYLHFPLSPHTFLYRINTSAVKIRPTLKQFTILFS